jgi:UDP-N-acetylglucosamine--N-acetylmuramyl-(pentapeptide) pyrophosphoryl-undecaprenol N-acetylglucosamine transferase
VDRTGLKGHYHAFEERMDHAWSAASVVICRSGAATIAEQITYAVPGILVPFPKAADDHQTLNANFIERKVKGGITCPESTLTADKLKSHLSQLLLPEMREKMERAILAFKQDRRKHDLSSIIKGII